MFSILGTCTVGSLYRGRFWWVGGRLRWIMLAKSWNYAFMDSRSMLAKSSLLCFGTRGYYIHFVVLMEPQSSENCAFFVLASGHKYNNNYVTRVSLYQGVHSC